MRPYAVLCGGLGGSRFVDSLARAAGPEKVTAIGNVGDDIEILGLHISPDLDTVLYTLAGLLDEERGWGVRDESYAALDQVRALGGESWFTLGDRDIGLHLVRAAALRDGAPLSETFARLAAALDVDVRLLPATDDVLRTRIVTAEGELAFQDWFVARRHADPVLGVQFEGAEEARPGPGVLDAIRDAETVFFAPSNPFVSIHPILAVPGVEEAVAQHPNVIAISPIVGGQALRGPLEEMLLTLGHESSAVGVAQLYAEMADGFVVDSEDAELTERIEALGLRAIVAPIVMAEPATRADVGRAILDAL